ncbi:Abi family protein [Achromobacter sp. MY14]|uniref:Abi family protein n=1 Tax=unclassified Achromobacter TaxID=2626865 RepID=UPI001E2DC6BF|nr:Abi family protein [Achromobacter sp. MY14]MCD0501207.1 Abi family protein [Achromobacter sp. MY14]
MPQSFHYPPILSLVSPPRLSSYQAVFSPSCDAELFGTYVWAQHVVGAVYPITQAVEVSLRNSVDNAARTKFGAKWWKLPQYQTPAHADFQGCMQKAENTLTKAWRASERIRLHLPKHAVVPSAVPTWSHDKIVAATEFSTWGHVLSDAFSASTRAQQSTHLWPVLMGTAFRKYNLLSSSSVDARHQIMNIVHEIREYRNRLFHHDKIWVSSGTSSNPRSAIDSIRKKINKMETLLNVIDARLPIIMTKVGVLDNARRVCSMNELDIYRYAFREPHLTSKKKRLMRSLTTSSENRNSTTAWNYGGSVYGMYKIR